MHTLGVLEHMPCGQGGLLYLLRQLDSLPYIKDVLGLFFFIFALNYVYILKFWDKNIYIYTWK